MRTNPFALRREHDGLESCGGAQAKAAWPTSVQEMVLARANMHTSGSPGGWCQRVEASLSLARAKPGRLYTTEQ